MQNQPTESPGYLPATVISTTHADVPPGATVSVLGYVAEVAGSFATQQGGVLKSQPGTRTLSFGIGELRIEETEPVKSAGAWVAEVGYKILDPDGWRHGVPGYPGAKDWEEPITRREFEARAVVCTMSHINLAPKTLPVIKGRKEEPKDATSETSVTELCAAHPNLAEYIRDLESLAQPELNRLKARENGAESPTTAPGAKNRPTGPICGSVANTAQMVTDGNNQAVEVRLSTNITDPGRLKVLVYRALRAVALAEHEVAEMKPDATLTGGSFAQPKTGQT